MNTCVNCKFITNVPSLPKVGHCDNEHAVISINVVTGKSLISSCEAMRSDEDKCGIDGNLFEQGNGPSTQTSVSRFKEWFLA